MHANVTTTLVDDYASKPQEKLIQDFGDGFLILEFIKKSVIYSHLEFTFQKKPELLSLISYRLCNQGRELLDKGCCFGFFAMPEVIFSRYSKRIKIKQNKIKKSKINTKIKT